MAEKIFFQSSLPRAGSTILQNIMGQNPDFYVTPTSGVLELLYAARANYTESPEFKAQDNQLMMDGFRSFCKEGFEGFYNGITDKKYVVDKSRGWGIHRDFLEFFYPEPKIICMVRDLREVFCSMEKNFRKSQHLSDPIVNHAQLSGTSTPKRIDVWAQSQPVGMAIERVSEVIRQGYDSKILFVKFEDLCMYPETEMTRIYKYLDVPYYKHDFENIEQITQEDDAVYGIYGDHTIRKELKPVPSTAKQVLGRDVTDWIWTNYKWYFDYFRYTK
jgi:sulfotransferase